MGCHVFLCRSLLLSTTVLNDLCMYVCMYVCVRYLCICYYLFSLNRYSIVVAFSNIFVRLNATEERVSSQACY